MPILCKIFNISKKEDKQLKTDELINQTINVEKILCEIRREIKEKGFSKDKLGFEDNFDDFFLSLIPKNDDVVDIEQQMDNLRSSWDIQPYKPLNGNPLVVFIKRIIRKSIKFFLMPIVKEQNAFNWSVLQILERNYEQKIEIEKLHSQLAQIERLVKTLPIDYNQELLFKQGSLAINYLKNGFSFPEENFIWTDKETAEICIPISITKTNLKLIIKGHKFTPLQTVEVIINNHVYGRIENYDSEFVIKADELSGQNYLCIRFIISKPYSPKELDISDDIRKLGFALIAISLNVEENSGALKNG